MNADDLRARQAPLKEKYREQPEAALVTVKARGTVGGDDLVCRVESSLGTIAADLHVAAGGERPSPCSGDMLLEALVACAGVTLRVVATAMNVPIRSATITALGDLDFRGTLGISKDVPVGIRNIRLNFDIDTDAPPEQVDKLLKLTERYCVIFQTLQHPPEMTLSRE